MPYPPSKKMPMRCETAPSTPRMPITAINTPISTTFEVWYDLPSLRREAVVTIRYAFLDKDNTSFTKSVDFNVAP